MRGLAGARFGALLFAVCSLISFAALAQAAAAPTPDANSLFLQAFAAVTDFRTGALLAGFVVLLNLLVNVTKIPALDDKIPDHWRPVIAVFLGIIGAIITARASGTSWGSAFSVGIPAGIAAGGGAVAFHEAVQTLKTFWSNLTKPKPKPAVADKGLANLLVLFAVAVAATCLCASAARAQAAPASSPPAPAPVVAPPVTADAFGGCFGKRVPMCAGPGIDAQLVAINLTKGVIQGNFTRASTTA